VPQSCWLGSSTHIQRSHGDQDEAQAESKWDLNTGLWETGLEHFSKPRDRKLIYCAINVQEVKQTLPPFPLVTSHLSLSQVGQVLWHQQSSRAHWERPQLISVSMHILKASMHCSCEVIPGRRSPPLKTCWIRLRWEGTLGSTDRCNPGLEAN